MLTKGFTLIELLVSIGIVAVLITVVTTSFLTAQKQTRDSLRKSDLEQIRQALEVYRSENGLYPTDLASLVPTYTTALPTDPKSPLQTYAYQRNTNTTYTLCASLEITPSSPESCAPLSCGTACNYRTQNP